jgi:X-X-X-Leu-X-X-Gly heptad repeat protein
VRQQFKNGANQVGNGAEHIGQGVKQAAIVTWEAIKDGATSFAARFN